MPKQPRAQNYINTAGGVGENIVARDTEQRLKNRDNHQPADDYIQRRNTVMAQGFVDNNLHENRRKNANNLHDKRRQ